MFNDNAFESGLYITGSGGPNLSGSGIYLSFEFGIIGENSVASIYEYASGNLISGSAISDVSITGSGGPNLSGSGIFFYGESLIFSENILFINPEETDSIVQTVYTIKPYAYFFKLR